MGAFRPLAIACLSAACLSAAALEERIVLVPGQPALRLAADGSSTAGPSPSIGDWIATGASLRKGWKGQGEYAVTNALYAPDRATDLLLHFDDQVPKVDAGDWSLSRGRSSAVDLLHPKFGTGAGAFNGSDSAMILVPGPRALFARDSRFRDFSIEFWLYPANAENGEIVLIWQSVRKVGRDARPQQLSCGLVAGRLTWSFDGFFVDPGRGGVEGPSTSISLAARSPIIPRTWTHHLLRFDGDTGLLEYLVDGQPEAMTHVTASGREGGTVFEPAVGGASPLQLGTGFSGLVDEFRLEREFVETPTLRQYPRDGAVVLSPLLDLGFTNSRLVAVEAVVRGSGNASVELEYRIADEAAAWSPEAPEWLPIRSGENLPAGTRGRYAQVRATLYADGTGSITPALSQITLRYVPDPPPPPPTRLLATARNGAILLRWAKVPIEDLGGYLIYYGDNPGEYFGTAALEGKSPVDAGNVAEFTLSGLVNGRLYYIAVAAYDAAGLPASGGRPEARAGDLSAEVSARPSRTAQ